MLQEEEGTWHRVPGVNQEVDLLLTGLVVTASRCCVKCSLEDSVGVVTRSLWLTAGELASQSSP